MPHPQQTRLGDANAPPPPQGSYFASAAKAGPPGLFRFGAEPFDPLD